jgi:hypothetical protein
MASREWKTAQSSRYSELIKDIEVSNDGLVRKVNGMILNPQLRDGYLHITRKAKHITKHITIHSLVAETFIGLRPEDMVIDHIDENKVNNHYTNLRYLTNIENSLRSNPNTKIRVLTEEVSMLTKRVQNLESQITKLSELLENGKCLAFESPKEALDLPHPPPLPFGASEAS